MPAKRKRKSRFGRALDWLEPDGLSPYDLQHELLRCIDSKVRRRLHIRLSERLWWVDLKDLIEEI